MDESKLSASEKIKTYCEGAYKHSLPKDAYLQVTEKCNCQCLMCEIWKKPHPKEGNLETLLSIIQTLARQGFNWVTLWGGEPYCHKNIIELMQAVKDNRMKLQLITNGTLLGGKNQAATLELADNVVFSLDAPDAETHDKIRGKQGTFGRAVKNLQALADKVTQTGTGPGLELDTTILSSNIGLLSDMILFSKQFGNLLVDYDPAQIQGAGNATDPELIKIPTAETTSALQDLIQKATQGAHISSPAKLKLMQDYLLGVPLQEPCISLFKDLLLDPEGNAFFCWGWGKIVGNILDKNFKQSWETAIKENLAAIDGEMERCKKCGFSHVRWPDPEVQDSILEANALRKAYFQTLIKN